MHRFAPYLIAYRRPARLLVATLLFYFCAKVSARETTAPVWVVSNGFHSSLAFRVRDLSFANQIENDKRAKFLVIGWGAGDFYRGKVNPWTLFEALFGIGPTLLHVVPVRDSIRDRFRNSDVVALTLPVSKLRMLTLEIDRSFARTPDGSRIFGGGGYYHDSRFYFAHERFYFPYMCNTWVALKLRRSGIPIVVPPAIVAGNLIHQTATFGRKIQRRSRPADAF